MSGRRGQISALLASTLLVSAFVGAGVAAAFTDAGVLTDANLNSYGNEGDAVTAVDFFAFCPVSLDVDVDEFDPETAQSLPDQPLERILFPNGPTVLPTGIVQWTTTFPGEYYVVVGYDGTLEQSSLFEGPGAGFVEAGEGIIVPGLSTEQPCGPNGFGVMHDIDSDTYGVSLPETLPPEFEEQLPEGVDLDDLELDDFDSVEEFLAYVENLGIVA
ncbi:hypothetical protein C2R22_20960 [Salinigranum rubrum]|uniref:Uncharacterized protein n=1 Tax=Salinigranum rubrum TaxID=755307 RepID=A0A2I8VPF5_9EURY|nr:hypothetical protein [Salinigranum rubrum]AUV83811.1 hypothetical protein C2R22_20960 [Salinigranum rubrum]